MHLLFTLFLESFVLFEFLDDQIVHSELLERVIQSKGLIDFIDVVDLLEAFESLFEDLFLRALAVVGVVIGLGLVVFLLGNVNLIR